jgi:hypothetical protein
LIRDAHRRDKSPDFLRIFYTRGMLHTTADIHRGGAHPGYGSAHIFRV